MFQDGNVRNLEVKSLTFVTADSCRTHLERLTQLLFSSFPGSTIYQHSNLLHVPHDVLNKKVDAVVLTGGIAYSKPITSAITEMVEFIAPVEVYAGENELESLAENGYGILAGEFEVKQYHRD